MPRRSHEETWEEITHDYHNLRNLVENSVSIRNFVFKCQDIVNDKLTMDREYYKSAKRFLLITKLLHIRPETRVKLIAALKRIPNFHRPYRDLPRHEQSVMQSNVRAVLEMAEYRNLHLNLGFLLEFSEYIFTKRFKYNSHILYQLRKRENANRTRRTQSMQLEEESDYYYTSDEDPWPQ
ncbi:hypothetical protein Cantr_06302 [Candida viswanathii]|uniref:Uncharacterized protein n=1 Tax=Candida viswanathii TaxID=5486 RepID=A0A367XVL8_9ASCO|nr:hypothetical protein Cantr_06302 [Candida viswanathii]